MFVFIHMGRRMHWFDGMCSLQDDVWHAQLHCTRGAGEEGTQL